MFDVQDLAKRISDRADADLPKWQQQMPEDIRANMKVGYLTHMLAELLSGGMSIEEARNRIDGV
ncbi:hypothetical protein K6V72_24380 [Ralstonia insidiosa]|jgi:hypothetical protein|uniref:Uncharacterized protein n=1 Tax=Ralstonia insidiosa TaxID=190721 RepID=A0A191ZZK3_9RALS|nr:MULTISPECIES: hypothetical protein [Ralstonia]ANJ73518.1 hypothetical protein A9Y76_14045 [Ralstonia insidiosa]KAB0473897.1 hypothetical protein F7R11_15610 [Ralstonia insidiosa]MBY4912155.1 hypothetical protein [Ralstonia insidiosa]